MQAGEGAAVALVGGRGIGKSRLASAVAAEAASEQATVLECACTELDTTSAYRVFRTLLAQAAGIGPDDPPTLGAALLEQHLIDRLGMDQEAVALLGAVLGLAETAAGPPPDLAPHQAGPGGRRAAGRVGRAPGRGGADGPADRRRSRRRPLQPGGARAAGRRPAARAAAGLHRPLAGRSGAAAAEGPVERIELAPLEGEDAEAMIDAVAAASPLDLREREQVLRQGEGVPFYLEELARAAQEAVGQAAPPDHADRAAAGTAGRARHRP